MVDAKTVCQAGVAALVIGFIVFWYSLSLGVLSGERSAVWGVDAGILIGLVGLGLLFWGFLIWAEAREIREESKK